MTQNLLLRLCPDPVAYTARATGPVVPGTNLGLDVLIHFISLALF